MNVERFAWAIEPEIYAKAELYSWLAVWDAGVRLASFERRGSL